MVSNLVVLYYIIGVALLPSKQEALRNSAYSYYATVKDVCNVVLLIL